MSFPTDRASPALAPFGSTDVHHVAASTVGTAFGPDQAVMRWMVEHRTDTWTTVMKAVTTLGNTLTLTVIAVLVTVFFAVSRKMDLAIYVGVGSVVGSGLMVALKRLFTRDRPPTPERLLELSSYSFPSGHAMTSTVVFGLIAVAFYRASPWIRAHPWVLAIAPLLALSIGITRVYLAAHWMTDVAAGWTLGVLYVVAVTWIAFRTGPAGRPGSLGAPQDAAETPQSIRTDPPQGPPGRS